MMVLAHSHYYLSISASLLNSVLVIHSLHNDQNLFISFIWQSEYLLSHLLHSFFILTIIYQVCLSIFAVSFVTCTILFTVDIFLLCSCINKIYAVVWFTTKTSIITCSSSYDNIWAAFNTNFSYQLVMQLTDVTMLQTKNNYFRSFL